MNVCQLTASLVTSAVCLITSSNVTKSVTALRNITTSYNTTTISNASLLGASLLTLKCYTLQTAGMSSPSLNTLCKGNGRYMFLLKCSSLIFLNNKFPNGITTHAGFKLTCSSSVPTFSLKSWFYKTA